MRLELLYETFKFKIASHSFRARQKERVSNLKWMRADRNNKSMFVPSPSITHSKRTQPNVRFHSFPFETFASRSVPSFIRRITFRFRSFLRSLQPLTKDLNFVPGSLFLMFEGATNPIIFAGKNIRSKSVVHDPDANRSQILTFEMTIVHPN